MSNVFSEIRQGEGDYPALPMRLREAGVVPGGLLRAANIVLQVARTYYQRWRFWIFGLPYLLFSWAYSYETPSTIVRGLHVVASLTIASFLACFVALQVRRQFGTPAAKLTPGFAAGHLAVAAMLSLMLFALVPAVQAWRLQLPIWGPIGAHALAGIFLGLVVMWRQAIVLLLAMPLAIVVINASRLFSEGTMWGHFVAGREPWLSAAAIAGAIVAQLAAARVLLGLSDLSTSISDDIAIEQPREDRALGGLDELVLRFRDGVVRRRLADAGFGWWSIQRWRIPSSISWLQLVLATLVGGFFVVIGGFGSGQSGGAMLGLTVSIAVMLIAPFNSWHMRRGATCSEMLRPVTRRQYAWQVALGIACDLLVWTLLASLFSFVTMQAIFRRSLDMSPDFLISYGVFLLFLWSAAIFVYGLGLATFRSRYWLILMVGLGLSWTLIVAYAVAMLAMSMQRSRLLGEFHVSYFLLPWILGGVLLAGWTIRRWLRSDVE